MLKSIKYKAKPLDLLLGNLLDIKLDKLSPTARPVRDNPNRYLEVGLKDNALKSRRDTIDTSRSML